MPSFATSFAQGYGRSKKATAGYPPKRSYEIHQDNTHFRIYLHLNMQYFARRIKKGRVSNSPNLHSQNPKNNFKFQNFLHSRSLPILFLIHFPFLVIFLPLLSLPCPILHRFCPPKLLICF